jgi:hypothetical protein
MAGWMISCKEYAELTSQNMDQSLSLWGRVSMKIHEKLCPPCYHIRQQFSAIRNACRHSSVVDDSDDTNCRLSDEACERMKSEIIKVFQGKD